MTVFNIFYLLFWHWHAFTTFKKLSIFAWIRYLPMRNDTFLLSHSPWSWYIRYIHIPWMCPARCEQKLTILVRVGDVGPTQCSPFVNPREGGEGPDTIKTNMKAWIQLIEFWRFLESQAFFVHPHHCWCFYFTSRGIVRPVGIFLVFKPCSCSFSLWILLSCNTHDMSTNGLKSQHFPSILRGV